MEKRILDLSALLFALVTTSIHAINVPSCCDANNFEVRLSISPIKSFYHDGDLVIGTVTFDNIGSTTVNHRSCNVSNINVDLIKPNLERLPLLRSPAFMLGSGLAGQDCSTPGETFDCPGPDPRCNTGNDPAPYQYTVRASEGNGLTVTGSCPPDRPLATPNNLVFTWVVQGAGT